VYVIESQPARVLVDERERRAGDFRGVNAQSGGEPFGEDRLARAEVTAQQKDGAGVEPRADALGHVESLFRRMRDEFAGVGWKLGHYLPDEWIASLKAVAPGRRER